MIMNAAVIICHMNVLRWMHQFSSQFHSQIIAYGNIAADLLNPLIKRDVTEVFKRIWLS